MKPYGNLREVKAAANKVASVTSQSDSFMYKCFPLIIETLLKMEAELHSVRILLPLELDPALPGKEAEVALPGKDSIKEGGIR